MRVLFYEGANAETYTRAAEIAPLMIELGAIQPSLKANMNVCFTGEP